MNKPFTPYISKRGCHWQPLLFGAKLPVLCCIALLAGGIGQSQAQFVVPKVQVLSLPFYQPGIAVEVVPGRQYSFQTSFYYRIPAGKHNFITRSFLDEPEVLSDRLDGYAITGEFRAYSRRSRNSEVKLYTGLFFRYYSYTLQTQMHIQDNRYDLNAGLKSSGLGLQFGIQWFIRKFYTVDLCLFGAGIGRHGLQGEVERLSGTGGTGLLEDRLQDIPLWGSRISLREEPGSNTIRFSNAYTAPVFRMSLGMGIVF